MAFYRLLPDYGMNYTLNRPFNDGAATDRVELARKLAPRIVDFKSWTEVWLEQAKRAESEERWRDAASVLSQRRVLPARG